MSDRKLRAQSGHLRLQIPITGIELPINLFKRHEWRQLRYLF